MTVTAGARLAAILPEVAMLGSSRHRATPDHVAAAGMRLGGIFAWGVEQGSFSSELLGPEICRACEQVLSASRRFPSIAGIEILRAIPSGDASVASFLAAGEAGEALVVLMSSSVDREKLRADLRLIESFVGMMRGRHRHIDKAGLIRLLEDLTLSAALEGDLAEEAKGLAVAGRSERFAAPRLVRQSGDALIVTDLPGIAIQDLPSMRRASIYDAAVTDWARMLIEDGVLIVTLRRDRLRAQDGRLGLTRWSGAMQPSSAPAEFIRSLVLATFGSSEQAREGARSRASSLLGKGLGIVGTLGAFDDFCISLISDNGRYMLHRKPFSGIVVRESDQYRQAERVEMLLLLRQLVWLRDLGMACECDDLSRPWRELAAGLAG